ncbi:MAG TPA: T9SS type A sorting domain-containing protein, partial [Bacteroidales bacterium]|nr:T9SS type A sorting domain-containing protein [Bacteroidales bacterium]HQB22713.1 T9SS type A sorting domain-containing protein [Bacteroidales bacterium]
ESNDFLIENIEFYSVSGKLISKEIVNNWEVKYNLSSFAKGFYLVKIIGENNKIINAKILVQ